MAILSSRNQVEENTLNKLKYCSNLMVQFDLLFIYLFVVY
jgi:hypothetical protein